METSLLLGKSKDFLAVMKRTNIDKYKYISSLDSNRYVSFKKWDAIIDNLKIELELMWFDLIENRLINKFYDIMPKYYTSARSFRATIDRKLFRSSKIWNREEFIRYSEILYTYKYNLKR